MRAYLCNWKKSKKDALILQLPTTALKERSYIGRKMEMKFLLGYIISSVSKEVELVQYMQ